jgi:lipid-A-disaccharide synthase-like uncharacterized protein
MLTPDPILFSIHLYGKTPILVTPWTFFGLIGNVLFTARVLVQWIASERQKKSIAPVTFWWASLAATLIMILYCIQRFETERGVIAFLLGYSINVVPYARNLMLIYSIKRVWHVLSYIACALIFLAALFLLGWVFHAGIGTLEMIAPGVEGPSSRFVQYVALFLGLAGNTIWSTRFIPQWIYSESKGTSVLPKWFWIWSLVGQMICLVYALILRDLVFILGFLFNGIPIVRNIMLSQGHASAHD